ncbi:hypothetical protein PV325_001897 [Microctonus aethiopoides]|uniref:Uncharacterized protein n=1 Tax=Microctonus aethiopoides TaxID=144406 RepID=A0AA39FIE0_9HYME|nr:hypothetical protein PV325_001897 [Microctonus aethiopoides]KAK0098807.1 hypothetical protein PV326_002808 [Microctonus aethiopoides]KAK0170103.1 hypothetical protein PV328_010706 [Microctonus aethiopoides]
MTNLQLTGLILVLWCIRASVFGGLLPENGSNGYQYNRPSGSAFGTTSEGDLGRRGYAGDSPERFGASAANGFDFGTRPTIAYGPPGYNSFGNGNGFIGRPGSGYNGPNGYNGIGNYPGGGGVSSGFNGFADGFRNRYNGDNSRPRPYSFQYEVRDPPSGNDYGQQETSDGNVVQGEYRVLLPDSRTQIVKYTADDVNGYNADVQYEGQAQFPRPVGGGSSIGVGITPQGYQFPGASETPYQPGFGLSPYQGRGNYNGLKGVGGGYSVGGNGIFGTGGVGVTVGAGSRNQYLPPGGGYGK